MWPGELTIIPFLIGAPWLVTILSIPRLHEGCSGHHEWWVYNHTVHVCIIAVQCFAAHGLLSTLADAEFREALTGGRWALEYRRQRWISYLKIVVIYIWVFSFATKRDPRATLAVSGMLLALSSTEVALVMMNGLREEFFKDAGTLQNLITSFSACSTVLCALLICTISASDVENCMIV
jgi:hypothetical protein